MAWIGLWGEVAAALESVGADCIRNEKGEVVRWIYTGQVYSFLGLKGHKPDHDYIIGDDARYYKNGKARSLVKLMEESEAGVSGIKVF